MAKIVVGDNLAGTMPHLAIQCFEGRHSECHGRDVLFGGVCECACHRATQPQPAEPK